MQLAEEFAVSQSLQGLWLWTQSWQAEGFYRQPGYSQFTRFDNFPGGSLENWLSKETHLTLC